MIRCNIDKNTAPSHNFQMMYSIINKFYNAQQSFFVSKIRHIKDSGFLPLKNRKNYKIGHKSEPEVMMSKIKNKTSRTMTTGNSI